MTGKRERRVSMLKRAGVTSHTGGTNASMASLKIRRLGRRLRSDDLVHVGKSFERGTVERPGEQLIAHLRHDDGRERMAIREPRSEVADDARK
jgi:hypothetical protein